MGHASQTPDDRVATTALGSLLRRGLPKLMLFTLLFGAVTYGFLSLIAPRYTSEVRLTFTPQAAHPASGERDPRANREAAETQADRADLSSHAKALKAPALNLHVASKLNLTEVAEFNSARGSVDMLNAGMRFAGLGGPRRGETDESRVLRAIKARLGVTTSRDGRSVTVKFFSSDAQRSAKYVNTLVEEYRKRLDDVPAMVAVDVSGELRTKIAQLEKELVEAETAVKKHREEMERVRSRPKFTPLDARRVALLAGRLKKAEAAVSAAEENWSIARDLDRTSAMDSLPAVQNSPVIRSLIAQRLRLKRQIVEAEVSLLPAHPRMKQLSADLRGLDRSISDRVQEIVRGLEKKYRAAEVKAAGIKRDLEALKALEAGNNNTIANDLERQSKLLEGAVQSKRAQLARLQKEFADNRRRTAGHDARASARQDARASARQDARASARQDARASARQDARADEMQIVSLAHAASTPSFPKKELWTLFAMAGAFVLGLVWMVGRGIAVARNSVAAIPMPASLASREAHDDNLSEKAQQLSFRILPGAAGGSNREAGSDDTLLGIAAHLADSKPPENGYRSIVTGEVSEFDPADEAIGLCRELGRSGAQVILVDWSLDGQGFAGLLDVPSQPGLTDLLTGASPFEDIIVSVPGNSVHFIPCGGTPDDTAQVLNPDSLNMVLDALDEAYDHIVVAGRFDAAQMLFEAIQGRFDAAISIGEGQESRAFMGDGSDVFLGFEVAEIDVIRYERPSRRIVSSRQLPVAEAGLAEAV